MYQELLIYGWNTQFQADFLPFQVQGFWPGRVIAEHRQHLIVITPQGEAVAVVSGKLRYRAQSRADYPAVGDWVVLSPFQSGERAKVQAVLPRQTRISRKSAGDEMSEQIIGANIDTLFIVSSLNQDFNMRRLERYLVLAKNSGAQTVLVMNKADLCENIPARLAQLATISQDIPILVVSALEPESVVPLQAYLAPGKTLAMIGSSGVGKSSLLNALTQQQVQRVQPIRQRDARGRHTTVHRQLFVLPDNQGLILDSPGIREIQLWEGGEGLDSAFSDIQTLVSHCRFRDCRHEKEPECAVNEALASGILDKKRWRNYLKLSDETLYLEQRKAQMREIQTKIKAKNQYKKARREALYGYLIKR